MRTVPGMRLDRDLKLVRMWPVAAMWSMNHAIGTSYKNKTSGGNAFKFLLVGCCAHLFTCSRSRGFFYVFCFWFWVGLVWGLMVGGLE